MEIIYTKNNKNIIEYPSSLYRAKVRYNLLLSEYGHNISAIFVIRRTHEFDTMTADDGFYTAPRSRSKLL